MSTNQKHEHFESGEDKQNHHSKDYKNCIKKCYIILFAKFQRINM